MLLVLVLVDVFLVLVLGGLVVVLYCSEVVVEMVDSCCGPWM